MCDLAPSDLQGFHKRLEHFAAICRWNAARFEDIPQNSEVTKELKAINKHAGRLASALEALNGRSRMAINTRAMRDSQNAARGYGAAPAIPSLALEQFNPDGRDGFLEMDVKTLLPLLRGLEQASVDAVDPERKSRPGQIPPLGLRQWLNNVSSLWNEISAQPFSRDVASDGEPITSAARFCVAAFQFVDPDMPRSRILNEMKETIRDRRKSTGRISVQNES
jgi:hypothetical protein